MADIDFKMGLAVGIQSARGTVNSSINTLLGSGGSGGSSEINESDGAVLGLRDAGIGNTGISSPTFERIFQANADLGFTKTPSSFERVDVTGLQITIPKKGNGQDFDGATAGMAKPSSGIDAILRAGGLTGANGSSPPEYKYTPAGTQEYASVLLLISEDGGGGAVGWVLKDVTCTLTSTHPPGQGAQIVVAFNVGSVEAFQETTWWGFDYGNQLNLQTPVVKGVGFAWGQTRDFASMEIAVASTFEDAPRSNDASTGLVPERQERTISASGLVLLDDADHDFEYQRIIATAAPTDELSFQVGTAASSNGDTMEAYKESLTNPETRSAAYATSVGKAAAQVELTAVDETEDNEYTLTFL